MKVCHRLISAGFFLASGSLVAMPIDWDPFITCTKEFVPISRPAGHFETVVAARVVTTCVRTLPPSLPSSSPMPVPDRVAAALDLPCPKIPAAIARLTTKLEEYKDSIAIIDAAIPGAQSAIDVLSATIPTLAAEDTRLARNCANATGRYNVAHRIKVQELRRLCNRLPSARRDECNESISDEANAATSIFPLWDAMNTACGQSNDANGNLIATQAARSKLQNELAKWKRDRAALNIEKLRLAKRIAVLKAENTNCPHP